MDKSNVILITHGKEPKAHECNSVQVLSFHYEQMRAELLNEVSDMPQPKATLCFRCRVYLAEQLFIRGGQFAKLALEPFATTTPPVGGSNG